MSRRIARAALVAALMSLLGFLLYPALSGAERGRPAVGDRLLRHLSGSVATRYWIAHPSKAPASLRARFQAANRLVAQVRAAGSRVSAATGDRFNDDGDGLPQNEESVVACKSDPSIVLGGTNDYRGLIDPEGNFTGWHLSTDGGRTLAAEGLLPSIDFGGGVMIPSGGDPVNAADRDCNLYAVDLNYDPSAFFPNGIGVYMTDADTLRRCPGSSDPSCWPTRTAAATAPDSTHFLDKPWFDVGVSGDAGQVVWIAYSDFLIPNPDTPEAFTASINAVRCTADLTDCTDPILISGTDPDVQFADVVIGPDGRVYVSWAEIQGELTGEPQTFIIKLRIADAGSTTFGPTEVVETVTKPLGFGDSLHANDWRIATIPKMAVKRVNGDPRIFMVWDQCRRKPLGVICEEPEIRLAWSSNDGATWKDRVLSVGGDNYFPTIAADSGPRLAVAWYTNRFDPVFHNAADVELVTVEPQNGAVTNRQILTAVSNETESDPWLLGTFIGDYFEVFANRGKAYVHYNANYRSVKFLGIGFAVPQQDNYLAVRGL